MCNIFVKVDGTETDDEPIFFHVGLILCYSFTEYTMNLHQVMMNQSVPFDCMSFRVCFITLSDQHWAERRKVDKIGKDDVASSMFSIQYTPGNIPIY